MIRYGWLIWLANAVAFGVLWTVENRLTGTFKLWQQLASGSQTTQTGIYDAILNDLRESGSQVNQFVTRETKATVTNIEQLQALVVNAGQIHFSTKPAGRSAGLAQPGEQAGTMYFANCIECTRLLLQEYLADHPKQPHGDPGSAATICRHYA